MKFGATNDFYSFIESERYTEGRGVVGGRDRDREMKL